MYPSSFDRLTRVVVTAHSRRGVLGALLGAVPALLGRDAVEAQPRSQRRFTPQGPCGDGTVKDNFCTRNNQCCTRYCNKRTKRCRCRHRGQTCRSSRNCCSRRGQGWSAGMAAARRRCPVVVARPGKPAPPVSAPAASRGTSARSMAWRTPAARGGAPAVAASAARTAAVSAGPASRPATRATRRRPVALTDSVRSAAPPTIARSSPARGARAEPAWRGMAASPAARAAPAGMASAHRSRTIPPAAHAGNARAVTACRWPRIRPAASAGSAAAVTV